MQSRPGTQSQQAGAQHQADRRQSAEIGGDRYYRRADIDGGTGSPPIRIQVCALVVLMSARCESLRLSGIASNGMS